MFLLWKIICPKKSHSYWLIYPQKIFFYHVKSFGSRTMRAKHLTLFAKIMSTGTADFKSNVNWIPVPYSLLGKINFPYPLGQSTRKSDWRCLLKVPFTQNQTLNFLTFPSLSFWTATTPYIKVGGYDFCKSRQTYQYKVDGGNVFQISGKWLLPLNNIYMHMLKLWAKCHVYIANFNEVLLETRKLKCHDLFATRCAFAVRKWVSPLNGLTSISCW